MKRTRSFEDAYWGRANTILTRLMRIAEKNVLLRERSFAFSHSQVTRCRSLVAGPDAKSAEAQKLTWFQRLSSCFSPSLTEEYDHAGSSERDPRAP